MPETDPHKLLAIAIETAKAAGEILLTGANLKQVNHQDAKDVKLQADVESEKLIRDKLIAASQLPIIGEEEGGDADLPNRDEQYWVVDPLDGTFNYLREWPMTCVSIGLMKGLEPVLGVIYDFNCDECYAGVVGGEFTLNQRVITPQWADEIGLAILNTGFPAGRDFSSSSLQKFVNNIQSFKKIRMIGSAALALAFVARGRSDAYYEESIRLWDIAAGVALVAAAGGSFRISPSSTPDKAFAYNVWATAKESWLP